MKYYVAYSMDRFGWCVYRYESDVISKFHAGAFKSEQHAESEVKRLNDIKVSTTN